MGGAADLTSGSRPTRHLTCNNQPPPYTCMLQVYQLRVTTRSLLANATRTLAAREPPVDFATGLPPFSPTWAALRLYFEGMFAEAGLQLPDEALELLQNSSFAELTGCPGVCTYVPADFPSKNQARRGRAGWWAGC